MASFLPTYTADGSATKTGINIKTFKKEDIKVYVDDDLKTAGTGTTAGSSHDYEIQSYTTSSFNIAWVTNKEPDSPSKVRIVRDTVILKADNSDVEGKAVYTAGSSVKAGDLNANQNQALRALEELDDQKIQKYDIDVDAVTTTEIRDNTIVNANISTTAAIAGTKVAPDFGSQNIVTTGTASSGNLGVTGNITVSGTVDGRDVATDGSKLDGIDTGAKDDQTSTEIKALLQSDNLTDAHLAANSVGTSEIKDDAVTNDQLDNSIVSAIAANTSKTTNQTHTGDVTGSVALTIANNAVTTAKILDDNVNDDKLSHTGVTSGTYGGSTAIPTIVVNTQGRVTSASENSVSFDVVADTSPQLGGDLDVQTREITTSGTNQDITLTPTGSGTVTVKGTGSASGTVEVNTETNAKSIKIQAPTNSNLAGNYTLTLPVNDGDAGQFLKTDGIGNLSWDTVSGGGGGGGTAAPNNIVSLSESVDGNRTDFGMSVTPASAQNLIVSVNGVVQKPNAGTTIAGSAEGYCVDGATLKFATAPANGSSIFIIEHAATTASDRIVEGNSNVDVFDDNSTSRAVVNLDGAEKFRINEGGQIGLGGANYGTDGQVLTSQGSGAAAQWESIPSSDLVNDTTPQLGGNLDVQASEITTSTTNGNIKLTPNGTGVIEVKGASGNDGTLQLNCSQNSHGVKIKSPAHSAGASYTLTLPTTDGNANQVLKTDGSGVLAWVDQTTELSDDTSPQLGGTLASNTHDIHMADNDKLFIGTGQDMHIFHDGTNSFITSNNGFLQINAAYNEIGVKLLPNAGVELYYDNSVKLSTSANGVLIGATTEGHSSADDLTIEDAGGGDSGITIRSGTSGDCNIWFSDGTSGTAEYVGYIQYKHATDRFNFGTNAGTSMILDSSGRLLLGTSTEGFDTYGDDLTLATSGHTGITVRSGTTSRGSIYFSDGTSGDAEYQGYVQYNHSDNRLVFGTAATERMRINSSGSIGLGTTSPNTNLHIKGSNNGGDLEALRLQNNHTSSGTKTSLCFTNTTSDAVDHAKITATRDNAGRLDFFVNAQSHAVLCVDGYASGVVGVNTVQASKALDVNGEIRTNTGILFGSDTAAANRLDDYEEGTFTPVVSNGMTGATYNVQRGGYVKIGRFVYFQVDLGINGGTANSNQLKLGGLPFASASSNTTAYGGAFINYQAGTFGKGEDISLHIGLNESTVKFYKHGGATVAANDTTAIPNLQSNFLYQGTYMTA